MKYPEILPDPAPARCGGLSPDGRSADHRADPFDQAGG